MSDSDLTALIALIAATIESTMYDRGERVAEWPADEAALNRDYETGGWNDLRERQRMVYQLRCRKAADRIAEVLSGVYAITPLPEPDFGADKPDHHWLEWDCGEHAELFLTKGTEQIVYASGEQDVQGDNVTLSWNAADARGLAAALLAAAARAQETPQ